MRSFGMLRISMIVLGFAAAMFIAPQCRAQFEIDPDHFDGTDSWQAAVLAKVHVRKTNRAWAGAGGQALHGNTSVRATLRQAKPSADYTAPLEVRREFFNGIKRSGINRFDKNERKKIK